MTAVLVDDFKVPVKWEEAISNTTYENAKFSHEILKSAGINRIYLVTHAWHMRRAVFAFESAGFSVIPAPTGFASMPLDPLERYLPSAQGLFASCIFMHEVLGWLWYQIKARI